MIFRESLLLVAVVGSLFFASEISSRQDEALRGESVEFIPVEEAAQRIYQYAENNLPACFSNLEGEFASITKAIVAVEYVSQSRLENVFEKIIIRLLAMSGLPLPNYSLGPAQIRPDTLREMRSEAGYTGKRVSLHAITHELLDECKSIYAASELIGHLSKAIPYPKGETGTVILARKYNGQDRLSIENAIYNRIIRSIYVEQINSKSHSNGLLRHEDVNLGDDS